MNFLETRFNDKKAMFPDSVPLPPELSQNLQGQGGNLTPSRISDPEEAKSSILMSSLCGIGTFGGWFVRSRIVLWTNVTHGLLFALNGMELRTGNGRSHWGVVATCLTFSLSNTFHIAKRRFVAPSVISSLFAVIVGSQSMKYLILE